MEFENRESMINNISWQGYWITLALLLAGYYLTVYVFYFRKDFKVFLNRKQGAGTLSFPGSGDEGKLSVDKPGEEAVVYACIDELDAFFQESKKTKCIKEEIIFSLQLILKKYPSLKTSEYTASLANVIVGQTENICSIHLNSDDLGRVWNG